MNQNDKISNCKFLVMAAAVIVFFGTSIWAQMPNGADIEKKRAEMRKLDTMIGEWSGDGWIQMGAQRNAFKGFERVQKKIGGQALLVEGKFSDEAGNTVHETLAVLSYDLKKNGYVFKTYLANGNSGETDFQIIPNGWRWGLDTPNGKIRYTTEMTADTWLEIGEIMRDGGKWTKFFEMKLKLSK